MTGDTTEPGERIAKRIARAGICSRRAAERLIADGRVTLDGEPVTTPATLVTAASRILVDGEPVAAAETRRLWRYHKPNGLICTNSDPEGRQTVFDHLPATLPRVILVGRLDLTSEGLLLLTNDGALARWLELPATGWTRRYRVRAYGRVPEDKLAGLAKGVTIDGVKYGPVTVELESRQGANAWLKVTLREGKNREVRKVLEHLGFQVNRLIRIAYGPFQLGKLAEGEVEEISPKVLAEQVGGLDKH